MLKGFWKRMKYASIGNKISEFMWELKYAWQRAWRGYDDTDIFGFGDKILEKMTLILEDFIKTSMSHPAEFPSEEWNNILKEMYEYLRNANEDYVDENYDFEDYVKKYEFMRHNLEEGMKLFTKYCYSLWS